LVDEVSAKTSRDQVQIGPGATGSRSERTGQPLTDFLQPLNHRREDRLRLGPAADGQVEALFAALGAA